MLQFPPPAVAPRIRYARLAVPESVRDDTLRERLSRQGEEALGRLADELIANPLLNSALTRALEARERAGRAQEAAMGALGIPSSADVEQLTRRLRSLSQRLEGIEDGIDRLEARLDSRAREKQVSGASASGGSEG